MAAYRADIEIGVRGARNLEQLRSSINQTARAVDSLNDVVSARGSLVQNIQNYTNNLDRAARSLRLVGANTEAETKAIREYVRALGEANTARARQNSLVAQEIANQRQVRPGNAGVGQQGPALPPALIQARKIQQNWSAFFREAAEVAQELQGAANAKTVNIKTNWNRFFQEAAEVAQELQSATAAKTTNIKTNWNRFFQEAAEVAQELQSTAKAEALNTRTSWNVFFQQAADVAKDLQAAAAQRTAAVKSSWVQFLSDAAQVGQDLSARVAQVRASEGAASQAARERLAQAPSAGLGGVARRPIAGAAYTEPAGPGGTGITRASAVAAEASLRRTLELQLKTAAAAGSWATALQTGSRWLSEDLDITAALLRANDGLLKSTNAQIAARKQLVKIKQFEAQQSKRAQRTEQLNESIALGVGFPLLFGGGLGSVAGSFAGSFAGKGFGGQIIGGALGQIAEDFVRSAAKVTSSTESIAESLGLAGTKSEEYLQALQEAGKETEAYSLATERLASVVGRDGVQAFKNLEEAGKTFNKAFAEISTSILALAAQLISGAAQSISQAVEETALFRKAAVSEDPQIQQLIKQRQSVGAGFQSFVTGGRSDEELIKRILDRQRELDKIEDTKLEKAAKTNAIAEEELRINRLTQEEKLAQIDLAKLGNDLTDTRVFLARQELIEAKFRVEAEQELLKGTSDVNAQLNRRLALAQLNQQREEALAAAAEKANKDSIRAYQQRLQLQNQLAQTVLDEYRIFEQGVDLFKGPIAGYEKSLILLERRTAIQEGIILNELESARASEDYAANQQLIESIYANRLGNLKLEADYLKQQLDVQKERAKLEQAISLRQLEFQNNQRRVAGQTEIDKLQTQLQFPFGGEQLERDLQLLDQYTRKINELKPLREEIETIQQNIAKAKATPGILTETQLQFENDRLVRQQDQLVALEAELQIRDQLEQQLLRQQQIYAKYGFIADEVSRAFSDSISGIITGTITVAEAFGRMFENIGKAFIDMATQILAQKLFFTIVNAITGGLGGGFSFSGAGPVSGASVFGAGQAGFNPAAFGGTSFFAEGGFVTGPTRALIGEGGEPEYVIPASKMGSAMARYATGVRGEGVVGGAVAENRAFLDSLTTKVGGSIESAADEPSDGTVATRAAIRESERFQENRMQIMSQQTALERRYERERLEKMTSEPGYLNVKYESQVINNVEYVTRDQAERLATQSALRGRELAIGALQNSVKTRKRVGMS